MSDKVTFSELVKSFADAHEITQQKAETLIRGLFDIVIDDLEKDGKASITNFGSFSTKEVAERTGINPQTKEEIVIPAHTKVSFKPYKALEGTVNAPFADLEPRLLGEETPEKEEPAVVAPIPQEEKFEDPFEEVISESNENEGEADEESYEESYEESEETVTPPPVYKAPVKEKEGSSAGMWILAILILLIIGSGIWYFFLRDSDAVYNNKEVAVNQPNQTEQTLPPPPPREDMQPTEEEAQPAETKAEPTNTASTSSTTAEVTSSNEMTSYIIKKDEWMWDISRKVYGEPFLWPLIFEANKTTNNDPNLVEPAKTLMVPSLEGNASNLTKADFARLATASKMVSDAYANAGNEDRSAEYLRFSKKYERHSKN